MKPLASVAVTLCGRAQGCTQPPGHAHGPKVNAPASALCHCPAIAEAELQTPLSVWDNNLNPNPYPPSKQHTLT